MIVAASGGFDPLHYGHVKYLEEARKLGDKLIVILNGNSFLMRKKGYKVFDVEERKNILLALRCVDEVYVYESEKDDVCDALLMIRPDIFAKGGDRIKGNVPEEETCKQNNIKIVYGVGGFNKINSSSIIIENIKPLIS